MSPASSGGSPRSVKSRLRSGVARVPGARAVLSPVQRARAVAVIVRSGLFDLPWYELQSGRRFHGLLPAVRDYVDTGRRAGLSPHPLFEPAAVEPDTWSTRVTDPLERYLLSGDRRLRVDPHPLFDAAEYLRLHPEAKRHPAGPLGHFLATATDATPLPTARSLLLHRGAAPTLGELRATLNDAVVTWRTQLELRAPRQVDRHDIAAERSFRAEVAPAVAAARAADAGTARGRPGVTAPGTAGSDDPAPLVSVILPTWNRAARLRAAVQSVQAQTLLRWELVVVDDGSTDDTPAVLEGLSSFDPRIRTLVVPHGGVSRARNAGIAAAQGGLLTFLDSDNTWEPEFLELMVAGMATRSLEVAYSAMRIERGTRTTWREFEGGRAELRAGNHIDLNVLAARTTLVREVGGFDTSLRRTVDYDLVLKLADRAEPGYLPFVGAVYNADDEDPARISRSEPLSWDTVVRARHTLDWSTATPVESLVPGRVSVLLPVESDWRGGVAFLRRLTAEGVVRLPAETPQDAVGEEPAAGVVTQTSGAPGAAESLADDPVDSADDHAAAQQLSGGSTAAGPTGSDPEPDTQTEGEPGVETQASEVAAAAESAVPTMSPAAAAAAGVADLEVLVLDRAGPRSAATLLAAHALLDPRITVRRVPAETGYAFAIDQLLLHATGAVSVLVDPRMTLEPGWLPPLLHELTADVLATAALFLERDGSVHSAGAVFAPSVKLPIQLLRGHPGSEAFDVALLEPSAPQSPAIAARTADLIDVRGLDPLYTAGLYDVDLGLRLASTRPGGFRTVTSSVAIQTSVAAEDARYAIADQRIFAERWKQQLPDSAASAWTLRGTTLAHLRTSRARSGAGAVLPVVVRRPRAADPEQYPALQRITAGLPAQTSLPSLRWAIMTGVPAGPKRFEWGDWYFAEALAAALRRLGQDAVVNPRDLPTRPSGHLDDVVLCLRGLTAFAPDPAKLNLLWVISHPDRVAPAEVAGFDRAFAASIPWSRAMSERAGVGVETLLQCTDPDRFSPSAAARIEVPGESVLFVGNSRRVRRPIVDAALALDVDLAVWGGGWADLLPPGVVRGIRVPNEELAAHYRNAGVVLNDHWDDMRIEGFLSNRLFDVVASGGRVISDSIDGVGSVFGRSVQTFDRRADFERLLRADPDELFGTEAERLEVAARIRAEHSFDARAARLFEVVLELQAG